MARLEPGSVVSEKRTFTQEEFDRFAVLTGDDNPIHVDPGFSALAAFGRPVAHGMFLYSCLCGLLADAFPGTVQEQQDLMFPAPTFTGEEMMLWAEVVGVEAGRVIAEVRITNPEGTITCSGETVLRREGS